MEESDLIATHPQLYHMAESGTWDSIANLGLLSTRALLDLVGLTGKARFDIESARRPASVKLQHVKLGTFVIRDQIPMSDKALAKCLTDMAPRQWFELLNGRVFFWLTRERLERLLGARAYRDRNHCVLTIDTASLVARHAAQITLSPINSGSTIMNPQRRGTDTFASIKEYPFDSWRAKRGRLKAIAELVVEHGVPDIVKHVVKVEEMRGAKPLRVVWKRA